MTALPAALRVQALLNAWRANTAHTGTRSVFVQARGNPAHPEVYELTDTDLAELLDERNALVSRVVALEINLSDKTSELREEWGYAETYPRGSVFLEACSSRRDAEKEIRDTPRPAKLMRRLAGDWKPVDDPDTDAAQEADEAEAEEPEPFFEPGHTYRSANGYFEFTCERILDGLAIGIETTVKAHQPYLPEGHRLRVWKSVRAEGCFTDVTAPAAEADTEDGQVHLQRRSLASRLEFLAEQLERSTSAILAGGLAADPGSSARTALTGSIIALRIEAGLAAETEKGNPA